MNKSIAALFAAAFASTAVAAEPSFTPVDNVVVSDYFGFPGQVKMGDNHDHKASHVVRFHLPSNYDRFHNVILQMGIRSTNKSEYNAVYVNPEFVPHDGDPCDSAHHDGNEHQLFDYLPYSQHQVHGQHHDWKNVWTTYHRLIRGHLLHEGENVLLFCARNSKGDLSHDLDNFYLRDITVHYRLGLVQ